MERDQKPNVDPERLNRKSDGFFGQSYSKDREEELSKCDPSGAVNANPKDAGDGAGARASIDPQTGEARGSGADTAADPQRKPNAAVAEGKE